MMIHTLPTRMFACGVGLILFSVGQSSRATIIGFAELGGSNATIPATLGSNAIADGSGYTVSNGTTPNIALQWDSRWDIHTSTWFAELENQTVGGGSWDTTGGNFIAQLDIQTHTIGFNVDAGYALVLESFDFANTPETSDSATWDLVLTDSFSSTVWSQTLVLTNPDNDVLTVTPGFTGTNGGDYILTFTQTNPSYTLNGRHGIDNLTFTQVVVPEPSTASLIGLGLLVCWGFRRSR